MDEERFTFNEGIYQLDDESIIFSKVSNTSFQLFKNKDLYAKQNSKVKLDTFEHEQHLILRHQRKNILISGCAHTGILNIQHAAEKIVGEQMDIVVSGFHLYNPVTKQKVAETEVKKIGYFMQKNQTQYYTCHCTGKTAYYILKSILGERIRYLTTGDVLEI